MRKVENETGAVGRPLGEDVAAAAAPARPAPAAVIPTWNEAGPYTAPNGARS
jgi:hypothetical protein